MNFKNIFLVVSLVFLYTSCSVSSTEPEPEPEIVIEDPVAALLVFPEDNTECNEGIILSETQSKVVFRWNTSEHTDSYEVILKDMGTETSSIIEASSNSKEITLERGTSYEWHIISKSIKSTVIATSNTFEFFNAAPGVVNHAPFSAEAISPENDSEITSTTGKVNLQWEATDIDEDIKDFEVFFGTNKDQLVNFGTVTTTTLEVDILLGTTYYWMVKTQDESDNVSTSEVFTFTVQ